MNTYPWLDDAWRFFVERFEAGRLAHALLIQGPPGTGKGELARQMAAKLLCTEDREMACGKCRSCALFKSGAHPDWNLLVPEEGKHQVRIDAVRGVISALTLTTTFSHRKVAMLYPAEAMNVNAANALLKSLEEPPGDTVIILVAHDPSRLPVTIRSRCQSINIALPDAGMAVEWLQREQGLEEQAALAALAAAGGSPLRAARYAASGLVARHQELLGSLAKLLQDPTRVSQVATGLAEIEPQALWYWLSEASADALRCAACGRITEWLNAAPAQDHRTLSLLQQSADRNRALSRTAVRQDLLLQEWLIKWAAQAHPRQGN